MLPLFAEVSNEGAVGLVALATAAQWLLNFWAKRRDERKAKEEEERKVKRQEHKEDEETYNIRMSQLMARIDADRKEARENELRMSAKLEQQRDYYEKRIDDQDKVILECRVTVTEVIGWLKYYQGLLEDNNIPHRKRDPQALTDTGKHAPLPPEKH